MAAVSADPVTRRDHREAQRLLARVGGGQLTRVRLEQAAYLGHMPARIATGAGPPARSFEAWLRGFRAGPVELELRAFAALARLLPSPEAQVAAALAAAGRAILAPADAARAERAGQAAAALARSRGGSEELGWGFYRYAGKTTAAELAYYLARAASDPDLWLGRDPGVWEDLDPPPPTLWGPPEDLLVGAGLAAAHACGEGVARAAIGAELVPWLLGLGDPLEAS
ncbi:MAG TPA: hypothetical protein DEA08_12735 [Planctomycetes bacterium]|nr:hypothetical protein [Planctomycetota bacterium]